MECKTFEVKISVSYDDGGFRYWEDNPGNKAPDRWITPNPYLVGKMLVVNGEAYGVLEEAISKEKRLLRGVVLLNTITNMPGIAFYSLPTNRCKDIDVFLITDMDEPAHNCWQRRGIFDWFSPKGKVKLVLEEKPYNLEQLRYEINEVSGLANKVSKTNRQTVQQLETLEFLFNIVVKQQESRR